MATLAQAHPSSPEPEFTAAEQALADVFDEIVETLSSEERADFFAELRADASAHGE